MDEGTFVLTNGASFEQEQFETITIYRLPGATLSWRFRLSWALARLAFWLWTANDAEGGEEDGFVD